jgi:hypothetical protein
VVGTIHHIMAFDQFPICRAFCTGLILIYSRMYWCIVYCIFVLYLLDQSNRSIRALFLQTASKCALSRWHRSKPVRRMDDYVNLWIAGRKHSASALASLFFSATLPSYTLHVSTSETGIQIEDTVAGLTSEEDLVRCDAWHDNKVPY